MSRGLEAGVGDRPLGRFDADLARAVRPDAFVYSVSPIPTIATSPRTSSKSEACPQSLTLGSYAPVDRLNLTTRQVSRATAIGRAVSVSRHTAQEAAPCPCRPTSA